MGEYMEEYFINLGNYESNTEEESYCLTDVVGILKNYRCKSKQHDPNLLERITDGRKNFNKSHILFPNVGTLWIYCLHPDVHNILDESGFNYRITNLRSGPFGVVIETSPEAMTMLKLMV